MNPLETLARNAKRRNMDMQCDPQWVLDLIAECNALKDRLRATEQERDRIIYDLNTYKSLSALYDEAKSGKWYRPCDVYETKELAIEGGWKIVNSQQADINKRQGNLNKRIATLQKAELG